MFFTTLNIAVVRIFNQQAVAETATQHFTSYLTPGTLGIVTHLASEQVDNFEGVFDDADSEQLLSVVASVHHEGVCEALHNGALGLTEAFGRVAAGRVGQVAGVSLLYGDVILDTSNTSYYKE